MRTSQHDPSSQPTEAQDLGHAENEQTLQRAAYAIYEYRTKNNLPGDALSDWGQAVSEHSTTSRTRGAGGS